MRRISVWLSTLLFALTVLAGPAEAERRRRSIAGHVAGELAEAGAKRAAKSGAKSAGRAVAKKAGKKVRPSRERMRAGKEAEKACVGNFDYTQTCVRLRNGRSGFVDGIKENNGGIVGTELKNYGDLSKLSPKTLQNAARNADKYLGSTIHSTPKNRRMMPDLVGKTIDKMQLGVPGTNTGTPKVLQDALTKRGIDLIVPKGWSK